MHNSREVTVPVSLSSAATAEDRVGTRLGASRWYRVTRSHVDAFRTATRPAGLVSRSDGALDDAVPQLMVLSMCPTLVPDVFSIDGARYALNYGCESVDFPGPAFIDDAVALQVALTSVTGRGDAVELGFRFTVTAWNRPQPACIADNRFVVYWP
jgi:acyl dehydratase